jgi:uroporphyrinogen decarboxylase
MKFLITSLCVALSAPSVHSFAPASIALTSTSPRVVGLLAKAASTSDEDLELTRKIILDHIAKSDFSTEIDDDSEASSDTNVSYTMPAPPKNDLMIRTALGREPVERTPVWLFRQAGRHLPEYHAYKKEKGRSFLDMLQYPEDVAECTLQPIRRYPMDAAILFSDILVIAQALNIEVTMPGGVGILVPNPLAGPEEVATRVPSVDQITPAFIQEKLGTVLESVKLIRSKMVEEDIHVPLIGFSGAPFTLMYYMIGGSSKKNKESGMTWLNENPDESRTLLDALTKIIIEYMSAQVANGAHMLQLFEAMGMMLEEKEFEEFALPCMEKIAVELKQRYPDVPLMVFSRGAWCVIIIFTFILLLICGKLYSKASCPFIIILAMQMKSCQKWVSML